MLKETTQFKDSETVFESAVSKGILSDNRLLDNYAGNYMYMGTTPLNEDLFKNINTREYKIIIN